MILDRLENWALYFEPGSRVGRAMQFLTREFNYDSPDGRIDVDGDAIYALVQTNKTKPQNEGRFESHRQHLDIQLVLRGAEGMGWSPINDLELETPYDVDRDLIFYRTPEIRSRLEVFEGNFAIFYPGDAHAPCLRLDGYEVVKKVVVKVRL